MSTLSRDETSDAARPAAAPERRRPRLSLRASPILLALLAVAGMR